MFCDKIGLREKPMKFTAEKLAQITNSEIRKITESARKFKISTDTRTIDENCFYLPLKGERFNGEDFIEDAFFKWFVTS